MTLTKKWKTTNRPDGPTGYQYKGTFRDVSLTHYKPEFVDNLDFYCLQKNINRSDVIRMLENKRTWDLSQLP